MVAVVEAICGLVAAGYLSVIGIQANLADEPGRTTFDRRAPFLLAVALLAVFLGMSWRSYRRSRHTTGRTSTTVPTAVPALSAEGRRELARIVAALADVGLLAPQVPDPRDLEEAVADAGDPVSVDAVLMALHEAAYWRPGFQPDDYLAALAFHDSQTEQDHGTLEAQVHDLARLVADPLPIRVNRIDRYHVGASERTRIDLTLDGEHLEVDYASHPKRLSTVLHVALARALHSRPRATTDRPRLAWLWTDQGVWLAALHRNDTLVFLNSALGQPDSELWTWVDEQRPFAAGEPLA